MMILYDYDNIKIKELNLIDKTYTYIIIVNNEMVYEFNCEKEIKESLLIDVAKDFKSIVKVKEHMFLFDKLKNTLDEKLQKIIDEAQ